MKLPVASHSFLNAWGNCPHKAYRMYIARDLPRQPQTKEMKWGNDVHSAFEVRIKHGTPFPKEMPYEAIAAPLIAAGALAEKQMGIREDGSSCGFFDSDVWLRGKVDTTVLAPPDPVVGYYAAFVADWKTGRRREEPDELKIHAVLIRAWKPELASIKAAYVWLQDLEIGKTWDVSRTQETLEGIRYTMMQVQNAIDAENFPKRRNPLCGWCPCLDCEYNTVGKR